MKRVCARNVSSAVVSHTIAVHPAPRYYAWSMEHTETAGGSSEMSLENITNQLEPGLFEYSAYLSSVAEQSVSFTMVDSTGRDFLKFCSFAKLFSHVYMAHVTPLQERSWRL